jgi:hypothetical protein
MCSLATFEHLPAVSSIGAFPVIFDMLILAEDIDDRFLAAVLGSLEHIGSIAQNSPDAMSALFEATREIIDLDDFLERYQCSRLFDQARAIAESFPFLIGFLGP